MPADLAALSADLGLDLSPAQLDQLETYAERLATSAHNLTSARDRDQVEARHIAESLALGSLLDALDLLPDAECVLDLGAGGGLPGIPLRIVWPGIVLTLLESVGKKCRFLEDIARDLALDSVTVLEGRAETYGHDPAHREQYDLVVARAVAPLPVLIECALPFLRPGGRLAAVKGSAALAEIDASVAALSELNARLHDAPVFQPPHGQPQTTVLIEKISPTPDRYPRRPGIPSKRPL
jgi:16S rRNA (guanine527-N7)-methyltransferase